MQTPEHVQEAEPEEVAPFESSAPLGDWEAVTAAVYHVPSPTYHNLKAYQGDTMTKEALWASLRRFTEQCEWDTYAQVLEAAEKAATARDARVAAGEDPGPVPAVGAVASPFFAPPATLRTAWEQLDLERQRQVSGTIKIDPLTRIIRRRHRP